jgi:two-component system cell cycle response regulator
VVFLRRNVTEPPLASADVEFAETVIRAAVSAIQRASLIETTIADNRRLEELALTDPLTKALNRRALGERLAAEMERVRRYSTTMSLLLIDLDHFKAVNDTHGHLAGDDVLIEVSLLLQRVVRAVDIVARYGGEEFVVVLPETGAGGAEAFAERLRELIEEHEFVLARGRAIRLTTSIGVACFPELRRGVRGGPAGERGPGVVSGQVGRTESGESLRPQATGQATGLRGPRSQLRRTPAP